MESISASFYFKRTQRMVCSLLVLNASGDGALCVKLNGCIYKGEGCDYFESLIDLRRALENDDIQIVCAGARVDFYHSGMSRDMSHGRIGYLDIEGDDLCTVEIFAPADLDKVGTVQEQQACGKARRESFARANRSRNPITRLAQWLAAIRLNR